MNFSFENKTVVITGGGRGIGKATAIAFAKAGANVVLASKTQSNLDDVAATISEFNPNVMTYRIDVKNKHDCYQLIDATVQRFAGVNIIIHAASDFNTAFLDNMTDEDVQNHFDSNVNAARWLLSAAAPYLSASQDKGRFIAISSIAGPINTVVGQTAYCIAQTALETFIRQAALEYGYTNKNILINSILPGMILTDRVMENNELDHLENLGKANVPVRRLGEPVEIANVCLFLASPMSSYIHGSSIIVDGGLTLRGMGMYQLALHT